jgi:hypothetical protein
METITEEPLMPMPMTRPDPLTGSGRTKPSARLLDEADVDRLVAQAEGEEGDEDEDEDEDEEDTEGGPA